MNQNWGIDSLRASIAAYLNAVNDERAQASMIIGDMPNSYPGDVMLAMAHHKMGDSDIAREMFAKIDSNPSTAIQFLYVFTYFGGRLPFDLDWTPNFSKRLAEAGVDPMKINRPLH